MTRSTLRLAMLVWAMFFLQVNSARAQTTTTHIFFDDFHRTTGPRGLPVLGSRRTKYRLAVR